MSCAPISGARWSKPRVNVGPAFDRIPNFVGADMAAKRLSELDEWKRARVVKCNPDPPQIPVRLRALYDGKLLFAPVPYLTKGFPYLRIDPDKLAAKGVDFETAATAQGFLLHGEPVGFEDMPPLDFCVVGCVAVTRAGGRTGKGAGFADLEHGIFRELGKTTADTPIATTVHSTQLVENARVVMEPHDNTLTFIATESELIRTGAQQPPSAGVDWPRVRPDQFADIPFLERVARRDRSQEGEPMIVDDPETLAEVEAMFAAYERALVGNDVAALDGFFVDFDRGDPLRRDREPLWHRGDPRLSRRALAGRPRAHAGADADHDLWPRSRRSPRRCSAAPTRRERSAGRCRPGCGFPQGWRIVAAHVSVIDEPKGA